MKNGKILWADDEIDLLKPHILFLQQKGYEVTTVSNGRDALEKAAHETFDLIILDENMPGLSGLDTLGQIKMENPEIPVVMITKSEEENIMNQAIGNKISDYLIKPVNPNQILLSIKKNLHHKEIILEKTSSDYRQEFQHISSQINDSYSWNDWFEVYKKLVFWELELAQAESDMDELLTMQKTEANSAFAKFVKKNYEKWITGGEHPLMSHELFKTKVFPLIDNGEKVFFILIDNFRFDQWRVIKPLLNDRGRPLFQYPAHSHAICPQRYLLWFAAQSDSSHVPRPMGRRGRRGRQKPERGSPHSDIARPVPQTIYILLQ